MAPNNGSTTDDQLEDYLLGLDPVPDPMAAQLAELVAAAETDRSLTRARGSATAQAITRSEREWGHGQEAGQG